MNLYRNEEAALSPSFFMNPPCEYRGAPFWAWNCEITKDKLDEQIETFRRMGMGGYHIHVRTGLQTPYLSDEYMELVKYCLCKGESSGLLTWLYDEDRWPSGTAGGRVTAGHPEFRAMNLLWTTKAYGEAGPVKDLGTRATGRGGNREENGDLLGAYDVELDESGCLLRYRRISADAPARGQKWYAYAEYAAPSAWFNNQAYIDTLNRSAVEYFVSITHERYREVVGDSFGKSIPAIFTDEPSFAIKGTLPFADSTNDIFFTWSSSLTPEYARRYGEDLLDSLPELFWELPDGRVSLVRYRFHDLTTEMFASAFADTLGAWCRKNGLMLSGHLLHEETLESQTKVIGEAMRSYRAFSDMPGVDILCDRHEYNTLQQAQSVKHQLGVKAMLSELYGVTGWDYDFRGFKLQGDWQAALGVTVRVPHLTWMSMKGEAKRDFPTCIGYQSPWCDQFSLIENHFARLNTALTRGKPKVRIGVIHPIESYWIHWGPSEQTRAIRDQLEKHFTDLTETLLFGSLSFDFISESLLPSQCARGGAPLQVGAMAYDVILVPACRTLRSTTLARLEAFRDAGGRLIFLDECPMLVDSLPDDSVRPLYERSERLPFTASAILSALEDVRAVDIRTEDGSRTDFLLHQLRCEGDNLWLFIARGKNPVCPDVDDAPRVRISIRGEYACTLYDTMTGAITPCPAAYQNGQTILWRTWHAQDSLLLQLAPGRLESKAASEQASALCAVKTPVSVAFSTKEPNALLLDMARFSLDGGEWQDETELLKVDSICRDQLGIPRRAKHVLQPYLLPPEQTAHTLRLSFHFHSETELSGAELALECASETQIQLNGEPVPPVTQGYYVDKAIERVALPPLRKGQNTLELTVPFGKRTNLEWCYLLGQFGVRLNGTEKTLTESPAQIGFGSIVPQGFPFSTGNFTYRFTVCAEQPGRLRIRIPKYRAALMDVRVDGAFAGKIAFSPYTLVTAPVAAGEHEIEIECFGLRQNGFGQVHHEQGVYFYQNPDSWRSEGDLWLNEYQLHPLGILKAPEISILAEESSEL